MTKEFTSAIETANELENKVLSLGISLTYKELLKTAKMTAEEIKSHTPMYTGNLNPKWKHYDTVIEILNGRINEREN